MCIVCPVSSGNRSRRPKIDALETVPSPTKITTIARILRIALPVGVVIIAASARAGRFDAFSLACGFLYVIVVLVSAMCATAVFRHRHMVSTAVSHDSLAIANGLGGASAALLGLWFVSRYTIGVVPDGIQEWTWLPVWV